MLTLFGPDTRDIALPPAMPAGLIRDLRVMAKVAGYSM